MTQATKNKHKIKETWDSESDKTYDRKGKWYLNSGKTFNMF